FAERQRASSELMKLAMEWEPLLRGTLDSNPSLELHRRLETVLEAPSLWRGAAGMLRRPRAGRLLELVAAPEAGAALVEVVGGVRIGGSKTHARSKDGPATVEIASAVPSVSGEIIERGYHNSKSSGALQGAIVGGAPDTLWQAGRLTHFQLRKLLEIKQLRRWRQPANDPFPLADWQAGCRAAFLKTFLPTAPGPLRQSYFVSRR